MVNLTKQSTDSLIKRLFKIVVPPVKTASLKK